MTDAPETTKTNQEGDEMVKLDKKALAVELCSAMAAIANQHVVKWRDLKIPQEDVAGMLTGALVNIVGNTAISISMDYITVGERMAYSMMQFLYHHQEKEAAALAVSKAH